MPKKSKGKEGRAAGLRGARLRAYCLGNLDIKKKPKAKKRKSK
tara:strand:+ start:28 stop:156 length:129 start_codon:yes stop_codon:yes gene_type:complete